MSPEEMDLTPRPEHRFTFGLWTVGNPGRDPFGEPTRPPLDPVDSVEKLAELGAYGVSLHDNDLVPVRLVARPSATGSSPASATRWSATGLRRRRWPRPTCSRTRPSRTARSPSNDRGVRRAAIGKAMRCDRPRRRARRAEVYVFWGGREGTESAARPRSRATRSSATARRSTSSPTTCVDQGYNLRFAIEPKPNEPRGDIFLPTVGHALHFITTLDHPEMVGVNPEVAHETMAGLNFVHGVGQALWAGKLFHIDLNGQRIGRYDQDFRFGAEDLKEAFLLVRLLETSRLRRPAPLRRARLPQRGRRGRVGLRRRLHADLPRAGREVTAVPRLRRDPGGARRRRASTSWPSRASDRTHRPPPPTCSARARISMRSPATATESSGSISSSSICCSARARSGRLAVRAGHHAPHRGQCVTVNESVLSVSADVSPA